MSYRRVVANGSSAMPRRHPANTTDRCLRQRRRCGLVARGGERLLHDACAILANPGPVNIIPANRNPRSPGRDRVVDLHDALYVEDGPLAGAPGRRQLPLLPDDWVVEHAEVVHVELAVHEDAAAAVDDQLATARQHHRRPGRHHRHATAAWRTPHAREQTLIFQRTAVVTIRLTVRQSCVSGA